MLRCIHRQEHCLGALEKVDCLLEVKVRRVDLAADEFIDLHPALPFIASLHCFPFWVFGFSARRIDITHRVVTRIHGGVKAVSQTPGIAANPAGEPRRVIPHAMVVEAAFFVPFLACEPVALAPKVAIACLAERRELLATNECTSSV